MRWTGISNSYLVSNHDFRSIWLPIVYRYAIHYIMYSILRHLFFLLFTWGFLLSPGIAKAKQDKKPGFENNEFKISLFPRTVNQTIAFYTGRGFPAAALDELKTMCFITISVSNKGKERVWFDLDNWTFSAEKVQVTRRLRPEWIQRWNEIGLEKRFQSTFRWTLMPEKMGLYAHEGEGGNITLLRTDKPITITAILHVGVDKSKRYPVEIKNVLCARDK